MQRLMLSLVAAGVVAGIIGTPWAMSSASAPHLLEQPQRCAALSDEQRHVVASVKALLADRRLNSAYSSMLQSAYDQLSALPGDPPEARLYRARLARQLGRPQQAQSEYEGLLDTCLAAQGLQGLGQLAVARGDAREAVTRLQESMALAPEDASIRADLGNAYLQRRDLPQADAQLRRAMELDGADPRAPGYYLTLLFYREEAGQARSLMRSRGLAEDQVARAQQRAERMRTEDGALLASAPREQVLPAASLNTAAAEAAQQQAQAPIMVPAPVIVPAAPAELEVAPQVLAQAEPPVEAPAASAAPEPAVVEPVPAAAQTLAAAAPPAPSEPEPESAPLLLAAAPAAAPEAPVTTPDVVREVTPPAPAVEPAPRVARSNGTSRFVVREGMPVPIAGQPLETQDQQASSPAPASSSAPASAVASMPMRSVLLSVAPMAGRRSYLENTPQRSVTRVTNAQGEEVIRIRSESPLRVSPPEEVPIIRE